MNISNYIESGIIERYLLGLASPEQTEELIHLRMVYPLLDLEITAAELRFEDRLLEEGVAPPCELKNAVLQHIRPDSKTGGSSRTYNSYGHTYQKNTYILEPFWNRRISVSVWWRCTFIALTVLTMALAASTWHFYHRAAQLEEVLIKLKVPVVNSPAPSAR
ncbi:hypothetical protein ACTJJ0_09055 [Chitinophaga sp. 22321]|uniref:Uncharacterized protein n=1 Tax=Chitinophaga hostae TaxID=2831022 RepID=A0ABS5IRX8_9BACT|nr:hypothetical protein [Chitinophaga hostae]MBS0025691.1 hypothetical protein [Chitinophaga hostae]